MKTLARICVVARYGSCHIWQQYRPAPPPTPLQPWKWPSHLWSHLDYAGPFLGHTFLVVVDAHSKWLEVFQMPASTSRATRAQFGLPQTIVTDNGPCFSSEEFTLFLKNNGILHLKSAPYHPSSNGLAERAVQTFKQEMKKFTDGDLRDRLSRFLAHYRTTPHTTTGVCPEEPFSWSKTPHSISVYCINTSANYCNIFAYLRITYNTSGADLNLLELAMVGEQIFWCTCL